MRAVEKVGSQAVDGSQLTAITVEGQSKLKEQLWLQPHLNTENMSDYDMSQLLMTVM